MNTGNTALAVNASSLRPLSDRVLLNLVDGVVTVDRSLAILNCNRAALRLLERDSSPLLLSGLITDPALLADASEAAISGRQFETLSPWGERFYRFHFQPLLGEIDEKLGAVIVISDVTHLKKLENMRREFVANVSHELKTPVTAIIGFLDTLLSGAVTDPAGRRRYLEIISRQAHRLQKLVSDLLQLSRLEQDLESDRIELVEERIHEILTSASELCELRIQEKQIKVRIECDRSLIIPVNVSLLEQALVNLIDNAITYSPNGSTIEIASAVNRKRLRIEVKDAGAGIPEEHLPRLFERFYRVDKGRSRELGGTGLGLSIVKHAAIAHGGAVWAESTLGSGARFIIEIPSAGVSP